MIACQTGPTLSDLAPPEAWEAGDAASGRLRRLTTVTYTHAIGDLLGDVVLPPLAGQDHAVGGLAEVGAGTATYSPREVEVLTDAAISVSQQALDNPTTRASLVPCTLQATADDACARDVLAALARRAWRRPATSEELDRLMAQTGQARAALSDADEALAFGMAGILSSPHFLYRQELDVVKGRLSDHALASRLSFLLWASVPDDALLDAAEAGLLSTDQGLLDETLRMLDDPRARRGVRSFFTDMLEFGELDDLQKDPTVFEHANPALGEIAREETLRLLEYITLDADTDFRDVMTTRDTFLHPQLATLYGVPAPAKDWTLVTFPDAVPRAGLLGHASFLARYAHAVSSSATLRGKAVRTRLLCQEILPPPVNVDTSIPEASGTTLTLRDRVAEHLLSPSCKGCHERMDPIGLGLEQYDGIGRYRTLDNGARIDPSGDVDDVPFDDALGLGEVVRNHPDFAPCVARTVTRYARGQIEEGDELAWLDTLSERFAEQDHRVRMLVLELVMSPLFRAASPVEAP